MNLSVPHILHAVRHRSGVSSDDAESIIRRVCRDHPDPAFAIRLWDGREVTFTRPARVTVSFLDPETFVRCLQSGDPSEFAEAYIDERVRIGGDLAEAAKLVSYFRNVKLDLRTKLSVASKLGVRLSAHTVADDTRDVQAHYDLSDDFFRLFLDDRMVYSCAYFSDPAEALEQSQERKLDLVCRKLRLAPGDSLLDIGCGWGALAIWAATHCGARVYGITVSANQAAEATRRVAAAGLADRVTIDQRHYATLPARAFDKVASIGMYEHVGIAQLPAYFRTVNTLLRPGGLFLNHGITAPARRSTLNGGTFIGRHVFPGGELDGLPHLTALMELEGFEIVDVESLRQHYALTLTHWSRRFQAARDRAASFVPERVLRTWDLYLAGCAQAFAEGTAGIHQVLAAKPDQDGRAAIPLTRNDLLV